MSTSTRESMRRELKELAKLAETMGKQPVAQAAVEPSVELQVEAVERLPPPASASRVSVAPFTTPTLPPTVSVEPKASSKRTGLFSIIVGACLAVALVGGAALGLPHGAAPATRAAAASLVAPTEAPAAAPESAVPAATPSPAPEGLAAPHPAPQTGLASAAAATPTIPPSVAKAAPAPAPIAHKHVTIAKPAAAPSRVVAAKGGEMDSDGISVPAAAAPTPKAAAKPAAASGGSDSLEDLIRKEVAAHK